MIFTVMVVYKNTKTFFIFYFISNKFCIAYTPCVSDKHHSGVGDTKLFYFCYRFLEEDKEKEPLEFYINSRVTLVGKIMLVASLCKWSPNKMVYTFSFVAIKIYFLALLLGKKCKHLGII
jgi:hypothetical protein